MNSALAKMAKIQRGLQSTLGRRALSLGVGAALEHDRILLKSRPDVVVDVGANRGQFALAVINLNQDARIFSFEPLKAPAETFENIFDGYNNVTLFKTAIGPSCYSAEINVSARDDSSSLLEIGAGQISVFPGTELAAKEAIQVKTLASCITPSDLSSVSMLKIDVQGFELQALEGCETLLSNFRFVYIESSFQELYISQALVSDIFRWLLERGFRFSDMGDISRDSAGNAVQSDFLFERVA